MKMKSSLISFVLFCSLFGFSQTYEVIKVEVKCKSKALNSAINSSGNDFAPFVFDDRIYFSTDRNPDVMLSGENNWQKEGYINLYQAQIKGDINESLNVKNIRLVSERFTYGSHTGPACFSMTGDTIFLSQVRVDKKEGTFYPQLYYAVRYNNRFSKLTALPFNDPSCSYGHPFYHSATQRLYFSSNRKGGKGGKDLYYSQLDDTGWSNPIPVDDVNSAEDELFPFIADNILFYATNPNGKNGGLDLYWKLIGADVAPQPLEGLNSDKDEFGIYVFPGMTKGFYSSNRNGNDDLYYLEMERIVTIRNEMAGEFKYKTLKGIPAGVTVQIVGDDDIVLYETKTDEEGKFLFREIAYDKSYSIRAMTEDELELTLFNANGDKAAGFLGDEDNVFVYRQIGHDNTGTLALIPDDMVDFDLNEGHLSGQLIYEDKPGEYPRNLKVVLVNGKGSEELTAFTDEKGNFDFKKLSMAENYLLKIPASEEDMVLLIYDLKGNVVAQLKTNDEGMFTFRKLNPDYGNSLELIEEDELAFEFKEQQTVWGYFEYENNQTLNRKGLIVKVFNENGELIDYELTDEEGVFRFKNLPPERSLLFKLDENGDNFVLDDFTLYIYDRDGKKIAVLKRGQDGFFTFRPLGYDVDNALSLIEEENLDFILGGKKNRDRILVYFDSNQSKVKSSDMKIVNNLYEVLSKNPNVRVEINAYADAKSSDEYNLILSKKRGNWIVEYLTRKGIANERFIVNAYGESKLVDEKNDALNRRAEIHLY